MVVVLAPFPATGAPFSKTGNGVTMDLKNLVQSIKQRLEDGTLPDHERTAFAESVLMAGIMKSVGQMTLDQKIDCASTMRAYIRRNAMLAVVDSLIKVVREAPGIPLSAALLTMLEALDSVEAKAKTQDRVKKMHTLLVEMADKRRAAAKEAGNG